MSAAGLSACGPPPVIEGSGEFIDEKTLPECPIDALAKAPGKVQVVMWHGLGVEPKRALDNLIKKYNASQDKVEIVARQQGTSYDEVLRKYEAAAATSGLPGIIFTEDTTTQTLIDSGTVFPSEACMKATDFDLDRYEPAVRAYYTSQGVFWPAYANVSGPVMYFNEVHFRKAGLDPNDPPKTLDELREVAEKLKKSGIEYPIALKLDEWYFECWFNGTGELVVNNNNGHDGRPTEANLANADAVEIVTKIKKMRDDGLLQAFSDTDGQINQFLALASQQSSITIETSAAASTIKAFLGGTLEEAPQGAEEQVDTAELIPRSALLPGLRKPGQVRVSGGAFFMVKGTKKHPMPPEQIAAAWDFFQYMSQPEVVADLHMQGGYLPVISPAQDDPRLQKFWKDDVAGRLLVVAREQLGEIDPKNPGPLMGPYPEYVTAVRQALDDTILLDGNAKESLEKADKEVDALLAADG
jgi:sn-glycerol 3-phosphate transport system substrate-binding protein